MQLDYKKGWHYGEDREVFSVQLDQSDFEPETARFRVDEWEYRMGWDMDDPKFFHTEESAIAWIKDKSEKSGRRFLLSDLERGE